MYIFNYTNNIINNFESHKYGQLVNNSGLIINSPNNKKIKTPGAKSINDFQLYKFKHYKLEFNARKINNFSDPFVVLVDSNNINISYTKRKYITSTTNDSYTVNFTVSNNVNIKILILLGGNNIEDSVCLNSISLFHDVPGENVFVKLYESDTTTGVKRFTNNLELILPSDHNVSYGYNNFNPDTMDYSNLAIGTNNLSSNTFGSNNTALGFDCLSNNIDGSGNIALGNRSLYYNISGTLNIGIGINSLYSNTTGFRNCAVGFNSLGVNTAGAYNTSFGFQSMQSNIDGYVNTAIGSNSLLSNTSGAFNTGCGYNALYYNTTGSKNCVLGTSATQNTTGSFNIAIGYGALDNNISGDNNIAIGTDSLNKNTSSQNIALGCLSQYSNTTGIRNLSIGNYSLFTNLLGNYNTAIGFDSSYSNRSGICNVSLGDRSLYASTGSSNTAIGYQTLVNHLGSFNTAVGEGAGGLINTSDYYNVYIGYLSGIENSGNNNTFVGAYAGNLANTTYNQVSCIGYGSVATGSNRIILGTASEQVYGGSYNVLSDLRDKADIRDTELGLDFIMQLRPVDYRYDYRDSYKLPIPKMPKEDATEEEKQTYETELQSVLEHNKYENLKPDGTHKRVRYHHGFLAQEVGELNVFGGYNDGLVKNNEDIKTLNYSEFIAPLVKSVQELSQLNSELRKELNKKLNEKDEIINTLINEIKNLKDDINLLKNK